MTAIAYLVYLVVCITASIWLTRLATATREGGDIVWRSLVWVCLFFAIFFGAFYVLGYVDLFTNRPVVHPAYGVAVVLPALMGAGLCVARVHPGALATTRHHQPPRGRWRRYTLPGNRVSRAVAVLSLIAIGVMTVMLGVGYPQGYEAQGYHLPIAVHIFQDNSLKVWEVWKAPFFHTYPANASLFAGFLLQLTSEHAVAAAGLLFLIPLGVAVYGIGRTTGADATASVLASLGLITMPVLVHAAADLGADVGGATFLAIAIYFAVARAAGNTWDLVLSGLAAGLAFGFKSFHLVSIAFLFALIVAHEWRWSPAHTPTAKLRNALGPGAVFVAGMCATGGFWLIRNYVQLGNPLFPVHLPAFDLLGWSGSPEFTSASQSGTQFRWVRSSSDWFIYPWFEWLHPSEALGKGALGPFFAAAVPAACVAAVMGLFRRETSSRGPVLPLLAGGWLVLIVWWILNDRQPRYLIGALVFLVPLVAWTMSQSAGLSRKVFEAILAWCIVCALALTFTIRVLEFGGRFVYGNQYSRSTFYQYPDALDHLPPESTVINLGHRTRNYSLVGKDVQNQVIVYTEAFAALGASLGQNAPDHAAQRVFLSHSVLRGLGATHLLTEGNPALIPDECVHLEQLDSRETDTLGNPLPRPTRLYSIRLCN